MRWAVVGTLILLILAGCTFDPFFLGDGPGIPQRCDDDISEPHRLEHPKAAHDVEILVQNGLDGAALAGFEVYAMSTNVTPMEMVPAFDADPFFNQCIWVAGTTDAAGKVTLGLPPDAMHLIAVDSEGEYTVPIAGPISSRASVTLTSYPSEHWFVQEIEVTVVDGVPVQSPARFELLDGEMLWHQHHFTPDIQVVWTNSENASANYYPAIALPGGEIVSGDFHAPAFIRMNERDESLFGIDLELGNATCTALRSGLEGTLLVPDIATEGATHLVRYQVKLRFAEDWGLGSMAAEYEERCDLQRFP